MATTLTILSTSVVRPSSPTPPQLMFLSAADTFWRRFRYNQCIFFFKLTGTRLNSVVSRLKSSLASVLVAFFPWAGRVCKPQNGRLALDCNDAGVPFIEASIDLSFCSLENDNFQHQPYFRKFAPHGDVVRWTGPDVPLLSVQVTRFQDDEGFVLGIGHSHIVADGASIWHFMKSWGECARGVSLSKPPVHMREALRPENLILPSGKLPKEDPSQVIPRCDSDLAQCDFHFTSAMLKKLKQMATTSSPPGHSPFSALQSLSAHLWKHVLAATDIDGEKKCVYYVIANMRSRLEPPLPEAYFGNAILMDWSVARKKEILQESMGATALRIQQIIKQIDAHSFRTFFENAEVLPLEELFDQELLTMSMLQISNSHQFPVYDVDFGLGPALLVRCPNIHNEGEMMWFRGREEGSIDVSLALSKPTMERLLLDKNFLSF